MEGTRNGKLKKVFVYNEEELALFDGVGGIKPIYIALDGKVYDVSQRRDLYGEEYGYHIFAGRNVTRSFAKMSLDPEDIGSSDLSDCSEPANIQALKEWVTKYSATYPIVGEFDDGGVSPEIRKLIKESEAPKSLPKRGEPSIKLRSREPLLLQVDDLLSPEECALAKRIFLRLAEKKSFTTKIRLPIIPSDLKDPIEAAFCQSIEDRCNDLVGWGSEEGEIPLIGMLTAPGGEDTELDEIHLGLHIDTHQYESRYATVLIFLTEPIGGATFFPVTDSWTLDAAETLLASDILHTDMVTDDVEVRAAKELLLSRPYGGDGMRIEPKEGRAAVFWSRTRDGQVDPRSFHGGLAIGPGPLKITIQKFKAIPKMWSSKKNLFIPSTMDRYNKLQPE